MAAEALTAEEGWTGRPATKGDLLVVQTHLEGKVKDIECEMANMGRDLSREIQIQGRQLWDELSRLRVSMVWMTVGVTTVLGGLITLFEFLS